MRPWQWGSGFARLAIWLLVVQAAAAAVVVVGLVVKKNSLMVTSPTAQYGDCMAGAVAYPNGNAGACAEFSAGATFRAKLGALPDVLVDRGSVGGKMSVPSLAFSWLDDKKAFQAGDTATIKIKLLKLPSGEKRAFNLSQHSMLFSLSVNGKKGNSSFISGVNTHLEGEPISWNITFVPIRAGNFWVVITEKHFDAILSSLQFTVAPGHINPSASLASSVDSGALTAGTKAIILVLPKDAFGNNITPGTNMSSNEYFRVSGSYESGSIVDFKDFRYNGWNKAGYLSLEFVSTVAGKILVQVYGGNLTLRDSPLLLTVKAGPLDMAKSTGSWKYGTNTLQIFSKLELFIYQKDSFGNLVPEFHPFDARIVKKASNLSVPVIDLLFEELGDGIQSLSFTVVEVGEFVLTIIDAELNRRASTMVYTYNVFIGYCDGLNSFANISELAHPIAGIASSFMVFLEDEYHNPSPIEAAMLQVQISSKNGAYKSNPIIFPLRDPNETISVNGQSSFALGPAANHQTIIGNSTAQFSHYNVSYTPQRSGDYEILVLCGNIPLNMGDPYFMTVSPGPINTSLSSVLTFNPNVKRHATNEIIVQLVDSFMNPIVSSQSKLRITSAIKTTCFEKGEFVESKDGLYVGHYLARCLGSYGICIVFEDKELPPCPFKVEAHPDEYFSEVRNDSILVWEDESVSFDVLLNDSIVGGQAEIINTSMPQHGSLLQHKQLFRYTPFEAFYGNDSFSYTISDKYNNVATGTVFISVLCKPPQFISLPDRLHVTEDLIGPQFGGFAGFQIVYSDAIENMSVTVKAKFGNVFLAPMSMQLHNKSRSVLSVSRGGGAGNDLILEGDVRTINGALQWLQYLGNDHFYGNDTIMLYAVNKNGMEDAHVPIYVEPINDPPIILAPKSIYLGGKEASEGFQVFDKEKDQFEFSIIEPDLLTFPANKSDLLLVLSLEVIEGTLSMTLPVGTIPTAEVKTESSNHWQSLQTFVTIADHFVLRGTGLRFRGTVLDCNNAMQRMFYQGPNRDTILFITVNDLANYGCYPDCSEMMSSPLSAEATVHLIKARPMNSRIVLLVGSAIAIEILTMLGLGGVLLFFLFKCMNALKGEQRDDRVPQQKDAADDTGGGAVFSSGGNGSNFRQRSSRAFKQELELQPVS